MEIFCHERYFKPLAGVDEIRLLHLTSAKHDDPLSGRLECVNLQQSLEYEALSYEWGSPEKIHRITLDDKYTLCITDALYNALRDIRHETPSQGNRVIWADGICINQDDLEERQQQVSIMGKIYRKAIRVVTYIGPEKDDSSTAIDLAYKLWLYSQTRIGDPDPRLHFKEELVNIGFPQASDPRWASLKSLLLRGWSSRCWCAQEFLMNLNLIMMCGRVEIFFWSLVPDIIQFAFNRSLPKFLLPGSQEDPNHTKECLAALGMLRDHIVYKEQQLTLCELLVWFHPFRATDPRDKVYSLLGLSVDREGFAIPVDYTLTCEQLYIIVAVRIMEISPSFGILYGNLGKKNLKLPSWVPDWSTWQFGNQEIAFDYYYSAGGSTVSNIQVNAVNQRLDISGCLVDRIIWHGESIGPYYYVSVEAETPKRHIWLRKQMKLVEQLEPYPNGSSICDVFWKTLIGNITLGQVEAKDDYKAYFEAHLNPREDNSLVQNDMAREFCDAVRRRSRYRCLAITERGYFGAVPETAEIGDSVCMFHGGRNLFLVRPSGLNFTFLGHAYIHGLMSGEVLRSDWYKKQTISLV